MKIGIIRETKIPIDNRVPLTPLQLKNLSSHFPDIKFKVQSSEIRCFSDEEYRNNGIEVSEDISDCDILLGIKEAHIDTLLPNKHYIFFGHIAKMQEYNKPLFKKIIDSKITFTDYEYLTDGEGNRLVAFGWFAGLVGVYYTLMGWSKRNNLKELPIPNINFTIKDLISELKKVNYKNIKIVLTGTGRVSMGAQYLLKHIGAVQISPREFLAAEKDSTRIIYTVLPLEELVADNQNSSFSREDFFMNPDNYHSVFRPFTSKADILISCHFWRNSDPIYISEADCLDPEFSIKMIGDVTCDIKGSIKTTLRASTHTSPFYDYEPNLKIEVEPFSNPKNISVMAVDTCPNALPREASESFGNQLIENVLLDFFKKGFDPTDIINRATITKKGELTSNFNYLKSFAKN